MCEWMHFALGSRCAWIASVIALWAVVAAIAAGQQPVRKNSSGNPQGNQPSAGQSPRDAARTPVASSTPGTAGPVVAVVNGQEISYKELAEVCIARMGQEVLETMISKALVMQESRKRGIKISAQEIDEEIGRTAERMQSTRERFLKMLQDERHIDPKQYAEGIVMPGLALKKLAIPHVKVTEEDIERGFEANFGEKVKCRWIMLNDLRNATTVWDELRKKATPGELKIPLEEFERQVKIWSSDVASRANGGQIQPIAHHTSPAFQALEKAAFALREDGEISSVLQLGSSYVILYREARLPPTDVKLATVRAKLEEEIYEAKLRDQIGAIFEELQRSATIDNLLTGDVRRPEEPVTGGNSTKGKGEPPKVGTKQDTSKGATQPIKR